MGKKITAKSVREETRKKMAAKYSADLEHWKNYANEGWSKYYKMRNRLDDVEEENAKLKEKLEAQKEWIERLMEFVNMPDDQRATAVNEYIKNHQLSEDFKSLFGPYFEALNRLNILSR